MFKRILFISAVLICTQLSCMDTLNDAYDAESDIPRSGLVGEWLFDSNGTNITYDTSGYANNGELNINTGPLPYPGLTTGHDGDAQSAYSFTTVHDSIMVANSLSLDVSYITVSFFIYSIGAGKIIMKDEEGGLSTPGTYQVELGNDGKIIFSCFTTGPVLTILSSHDSIAISKWYHVACTFDGTVMRIYIDGMLNKEKNLSGTLLSSTFNTYIGQVKNDGICSDSFTGKIDNVRIYNRALSEDEIKLLADE